MVCHWITYYVTQEVPEVSEKVMMREVQPLISSGCLKKGVVGIVIFVVVMVYISSLTL